jgi:hypothetical protein
LTLCDAIQAFIAADNAYFWCCLLAHRFDRGDFGYAEYLARLGNLVAGFGSRFPTRGFDN